MIKVRVMRMPADGRREPYLWLEVEFASLSLAKAFQAGVAAGSGHDSYASVVGEEVSNGK